MKVYPFAPLSTCHAFSGWPFLHPIPDVHVRRGTRVQQICNRVKRFNQPH